MGVMNEFKVMGPDEEGGATGVAKSAFDPKGQGR